MPEPDEPIIEMTSPLLAEREIPLSTSVVPKDLRMSVAVSMTVMSDTLRAKQKTAAERR